MKIIWSEKAILDYHQNIDYLLANWPAQVATEFIEDVEGITELIKIHPELYPLAGHKEIRRAVVRIENKLHCSLKLKMKQFISFGSGITINLQKN